ncbi:MAG: M20/M25/M40 family metallo-hydrolase [Alphaproteobacteria bacterium]|nr:M20/M25/M40 family metallo-hydrolase [Alphaproteobacteria bacterium]MCL2505670.1 M20/M25/M40 family metallo-hydrolase [Alphaproteobacteria bacterium]
MAENVKEILADLVEIDTMSFKSNIDFIVYVRDFLAKHGIESKIIIYDGKKACLFAQVGDNPKFMLAAHSDTVPANEQGWDTPPLELTEKDGKLYGLGTADMKGFIACILALVAEGGKDFYIGITADEEITMGGAENISAYLNSRKIKPKGILLGEPSKSGIITRHKGTHAFKTTVYGEEAHDSNRHKAEFAYRITVSGKSAHASNPDKGLSAIEIMGVVIKAISKVRRELKQSSHESSSVEVPYSTINMGEIEGGDARNKVPEKCSLDLFIGLHPNDRVEDISALIDAEIKELLKTEFPNAEDKGLGIHIENLSIYPRSSVGKDSEAFASNPEEGWNTTEIMGVIIRAISEVSRELKQSPHESPSFEVPYSTINMAKTKKGNLEWSTRLHTNDNADDILERINARIKELLTAEFPDFEMKEFIHTESLGSYPGYSLDQNSEIFAATFRATAKVKGKVPCFGANFGTEAGIYSKRLGVPVVISSPASIDHAHKPNEFVSVPELEEYMNVLREMFLPAPQAPDRQRKFWSSVAVRKNAL